MTSKRQLKANRANALASTGPKTREGKIRSAQNAHRHGLSVSVRADQLLSEDAENLALSFAGEGASAELLESARRAAEAQIDLIRIRKVLHDLFVRNLKYQIALPEPRVAHEAKQTLLNGYEISGAILSEIPNEYTALDRYERRARSRRKFAIRELDALRRQTAS